MNKKILVVVILLLAASGLFGYQLFLQSKIKTKTETETNNVDISRDVIETVAPTNAIVGGDKDEHGCIGSAGYSWCEEKSKCLRIWEESCPSITNSIIEGQIQELLAKKYSKPISEVKVTITKQTEGYAGGSVLFGEGGPGEGGLFLARKVNDVWELVYDGNGSVDCTKLRQEYQFPDEILKPNFCD